MGSKQRAGKGGWPRLCYNTSEPAAREGEQAPQEMTARRKFLAQMEQVVPWAALLTVLQPFYPQVGPQGGRAALSPRETVKSLVSAAVSG